MSPYHALGGFLVLLIGVSVAADAESTGPRTLLETRALRVIVDEGGAWCGQAAAHVHFLADERSVFEDDNYIQRVMAGLSAILELDCERAESVSIDGWVREDLVYAATAAVSKGWRVERDDVSVRAASALPLPRHEALPGAESVTPSDDRVAAPAASSSLPEYAKGPQTSEPSAQASAAGEPVRLRASHSNAGWTFYLQFLDAPQSVEYRLAGASAFEPTGFQELRDQRTGLPVPFTHFSLPSGTAAQEIEIRFRDVAGQVQGPYRLPFDPEHSIRSQAKGILDQMWTAWIDSNESECSMGTIKEPCLLVYFTHLISWRCGLARIRFGLDDEPLTREFPLPTCEPEDSIAISSDTQIYIRAPVTTREVRVQLDYYDGTTSKLRSFRP